MSEVAIIKPKTSLEELHSLMSREVESSICSRLNQQRKMQLLRRICSVYFFLQSKFGIGRRHMTLEEFELGERALKELAHSKLKGSWNAAARCLGLRFRWAHYLKRGWFGRGTPYGAWWYAGGCYLAEPILEGHVDLNRISICPSNWSDLLEELFEKEFR